MDLSSVALLMVAAALHSAWNLLSKQSFDKQAFLWLAMPATTVLFAATLPWLYAPFPAQGWAVIALSGLLEGVYLLLLGRAYQHGDLSLVYPLARGSAVVFITMLAVPLLDERLSALAVPGIAVILCGMYVATTTFGSVPKLRALRGGSTSLALLTGLSIAGYSLVDKVGLRYVPPLLYVYCVFSAAALVLAPYMLGARRAAVLREWQANKWRILVVATMFVATYAVVLLVLTTAQISYVAPIREVSVIFAALLGTLVLREPFGRQKTIGAALIFAGIVCISLTS